MLICPSCRKQYEASLLVCRQCGTELLPPSALQLKDRYPSWSSDQPPFLKTQPEEIYVDLLQCSLTEAKDIIRLLEPEGISCLIERNENFRFQYCLEGGSQIADQKSLIVKVKATELSKARALLEWEFQQEQDEAEMAGYTTDESELASCPSCEAELSPGEEICPDCGLALEAEDEEESALGERESYRCSACGAPCRQADPICPSCGARFDH